MSALSIAQEIIVNIIDSEINPMVTTKYADDVVHITLDQINPDIMTEMLKLWLSVTKPLVAASNPIDRRSVVLTDGERDANWSANSPSFLPDHFIPEMIIQGYTFPSEQITQGHDLYDFQQGIMAKIKEHRDMSNPITWSEFGANGDGLMPVAEESNNLTRRGYRIIITDDKIKKDSFITISSVVDLEPDGENNMPTSLYRHKDIGHPSITNQEDGYMVLRVMYKTCCTLKYTIDAGEVNEDSNPDPELNSSVAFNLSDSSMGLPK